MADSRALAELKESDATGTLADIYSDIRVSLRVPMVNLIFRHMATVPGCLEWVWASIGPLYASGRLVAQANAMMANSKSLKLGVEADDITSWGLDAPSHTKVIATCDAYGRANPANLLGLKALNFILAETPMARSRRKPARGLAPKPEALELAALPPMADLTTLSAETKTILMALTGQLHGNDGRVIPSFYRHFTAWPEMLSGLHKYLQPLIDDGALAEGATALDHAAHGLARVLYLDCPTTRLEPPSEAALTTLRELIELFPPNICKMTLIARAMGAAIATTPSSTL